MICISNLYIYIYNLPCFFLFAQSFWHEENGRQDDQAKRNQPLPTSKRSQLSTERPKLWHTVHCVKTFAMPWSLGPSWCCAFWDPPLRHNPNASGASVESVTGNLPLANVMRNLVWWWKGARGDEQSDFFLFHRSYRCFSLLLFVPRTDVVVFV